ncbi:hypothetical protein DP939_29535 [Spongiactinospora rosea]|uniref:Histidine kinase/HSP90-like ATPase domain-containing protein n=1 Tax=Spongiactinospora rosea TaxID=2248750 RepID=A0A366LSV3_9ACTN|nr:ATP-binding protein [Spongiactinospora rosea]RBQ16469.1 hypothetical protein DP939_29535 [Spongiactinospora rosea]
MTAIQISATIASRRDSLTLVALPDSAYLARAYSAATIRGWGLVDEEFVDNARLVVSELVTNAIEAAGLSEKQPKLSALLTGASLIRLVLEIPADLDALVIEVWDAAPHTPEPRGDVPFDSIRGRGLALVDALAAGWGYRCPKDAPPPWTKVVYALMRFP